MKFNGETHKVIIESLNSTEAMAYVCFLKEEQIRHEEEVGECLQRIKAAEFWRPTGYSASMEFWESARVRHANDISDIKALIEKVRELFE